MKVRRLQRHEASLYRKIRLNMLVDSPSSFGESFAHAHSMPDSYWAEMVERAATSAENATFIAFDGPIPCGAVSGMIIAPPVLSDEQTAILSRAVKGTCPTPDEAKCLGPQFHATVSLLVKQQWSDGREVFDVLAHGGLKIADIMRIVPPPREPAAPDGAEPPPADGLFGRHITCTAAMINGMWVAPSHRRKGIGRALLDAVIAWAKEQGAQRLELGVSEGNTPAIHLYEQLGFVETSRPTPSAPNGMRRFRFMERSL